MAAVTKLTQKFHPKSYYLFLGLLLHLATVFTAGFIVVSICSLVVQGILQIVLGFICFVLLHLLANKLTNHHAPTLNIDESALDVHRITNTGDVQADRVFAKYYTGKPVLYHHIKSLESEEVIQLRENLMRIPDWVDKKAIHKATQFYNDNITIILSGLTLGLVDSYNFPIDAKVRHFLHLQIGCNDLI